MPLLSVIVPVYNEEKTIEKILKVIESVDIDKEIIIVDDNSTDGTRAILKGLNLPGLKVFAHNENLGKGAAFRTGLQNACGDIVIIQDADLEYDPKDYHNLVSPLLKSQADLVLGVRFMKGYKGLLMHRWGNRFLTCFLNILYGCRLNDVFTCYKVAHRKLFNSFDLKSNDFQIEQEIIIKALKRKLNIHQVPISYHPRRYSEGKKIRFHDGFKMIFQMLHLKFMGE